jgi:hypothetical protein
MYITLRKYVNFENLDNKNFLKSLLHKKLKNLCGENKKQLELNNMFTNFGRTYLKENILPLVPKF